jgi:uncharacterized protein YjbI with pentapeptide repeats
MRSVTAAHPKDRADIEDNFRKTIGQALGGIFVLLAAGLAYYGTLQTMQVNEDQALHTQQSGRDLLISNQVSRGFEQLASKETVMQLGGIYALEGVMRASEQYHQPVLEALCAFVRDRTKTETGDGPPATEIQAALTVIGRRKPFGDGYPDLAHTHLRKAFLSTANLSGANLSNADLSGSDLSGTDLTFADLDNANLTNANFTAGVKTQVETQAGPISISRWVGRPADLTRATLFNADLGGANLGGAKLTDAKLIGAHLVGTFLDAADLSLAALDYADLTGAHLAAADLRHAILADANLTGATLTEETILTDTDLRGARVTQAQLDQACGTDVKLDPGLIIKPCR